MDIIESEEESSEKREGKFYFFKREVTYSEHISHELGSIPVTVSETARTVFQSIAKGIRTVIFMRK